MPYPKQILIRLLAVAGLLAGCASVQEQRISAHQEAWQKLSPADQARLKHGAVRMGDTEEMVSIALGPPDKVLPANPADGRQQAVWVYTQLTGGPSGNTLPETQPSNELELHSTERRVTFQEGMVVGNKEIREVPAETRVPARMGSAGLGIGQGGINVANQLSSLDEAVGLTPEQRVKAREILEKEADALNALVPAERMEKGMPFRLAARDDLRELLTPEQRRKQDNLRRVGQAQDAAERTFVTDFVRSSPGIAARLGAVASLSLVTSSITQNDDVRLGRYTYTVLGEKKSETLKIFWEKVSASAPMKITKVEASDGTVIPL